MSERFRAQLKLRGDTRTPCYCAPWLTLAMIKPPSLGDIPLTVIVRGEPVGREPEMSDADDAK